MSAAIKRLSTIIRPHPHTPSASNQKEYNKTESNPIDAPTAPDASMNAENSTNIDSTSTAAPAPVSASETPVSAPVETPTVAASASAGDPVTSAELPKEGLAVDTNEPTVAPTAETAQKASAVSGQAPASGTANEGKPTEPAAAVTTTTTSEASKKAESKHETTSTKGGSRRTREIGRDTIRRFSTILRSGNGSHVKEKGVPPVPVAPTAQDETAKPDEVKPSDTETHAPAVTTGAESAPPAPVEKPKTTSDFKSTKSATAAKTKEKEKTDKPKIATRRGSSFFSAARDVVRGPQRKDTPKSKSATRAELAVSTPRPVKKGAAKGKRVVVITGASRGVGLEFVKQYAAQPDTFVIALSRTVDKAAEVRSIVNESAKSGYNVRPIRVDIGNSKSVASAVKEVVELTDGRIDLLIHAAGTKAEPALRMTDIKGSELEEELRYNLVGPIALTNALLPHLKPLPPPPQPVTEEVKPEATANHNTKEQEPVGTANVEETKADAKLATTETDVNRDTPAVPEATVEATPKDVTPTPAVESTPAMAAAAEPTNFSTAESDTLAEAGSKSMPKAEESKETDELKSPEPAVVPSDFTQPMVPAVVEPEAAPMQLDEGVPTAHSPAYFPSAPYVVFLAPADPIVNDHGIVPIGSGFVPAPKTLFSLSRSALQVAIAKYGMCLGRQAGVVGIERPGVLDPHTNITEAQAVKSVLEYLPTLTINHSGRLLSV